jgi:hypothetical protein
MEVLSFDNSCRLWDREDESFFRNRELQPLRQHGPHCVATTLAILTGSAPEEFQGVINTQDPVSWSKALRPWNMKLAYCPTDVRRVGFYLPELVELDDLFTISYYLTRDSGNILADPNEQGWVCSSHVVVLHRSQIFDPASGRSTDALTHHLHGYHTKRIFRVVPANHLRGL